MAVERLIKAYFWKNNKQEPPYNHNLLILATKSGLNDQINEERKQLLFKLMPLNIEARYPTNKQEISRPLLKIIALLFLMKRWNFQNG